MKLVIRKGDKLVIQFKKCMFPMINGLFTVERINSRNTFLVSSSSGVSCLLDINQHGKEFTIKSVDKPVANIA